MNADYFDFFLSAYSAFIRVTSILMRCSMKTHPICLRLSALFIVLLAACTPATPGAPASGATLTVTSAAFAEGTNIPRKFTCDAENVSPPLKWTGAPNATQSFVLIMDDPDAPLGTFTHWVVFDLLADLTEIPEGAKNLARAGRNSAGQNGYTGPCPPSGTHRYFFTVYALDVSPHKLSEGAGRDQVIAAMQGHVLAQGSLMGRYGR
jgi:Raf kinase inhibitor-like YbhB/YbcL family protein